MTDRKATEGPFDHAFYRSTDGHGHRPRWTSEEVAAHRELEEAFREWAREHGLVWFDTDRRLALAIAASLGIDLEWADDED